MLSMFRKLTYPSSGPCDYSVELPHWSHVLGLMCVGVSVRLYWSGIRAACTLVWPSTEVVTFCWPCISVAKHLDAQNFCFTISLFHASTCFEHMCSSSGGQNCITQPLVSSNLQVVISCTGWERVLSPVVASLHTKKSSAVPLRQFLRQLCLAGQRTNTLQALLSWYE